jgi:hypothetical protein
MKLTLNTIVGTAVALVVLFVIASAVKMPFFASTYEYGFGTEPCAKAGCTASSSASSLINPNCATPSGSVVACASCNISTGYSTFLKSCASEIAWSNNTLCNGCSSLYGWNSMYTGMLAFILIIGLIGFALMFLNTKK